jgi:hypothetical protein
VLRKLTVVLAVVVASLVWIAPAVAAPSTLRNSHTRV